MLPDLPDLPPLQMPHDVLAAPHALRKSISVDSFAHNSRPDASPDSDVDRADPTRERYRRPSLKTPLIPKPLVRAGELPLPSRSPAITLSPSSSSLSNLSPPSSRRAPNAPMPAPARIRSGSLGRYTTPVARRIHLNTHSSSHESSNPVTLVVVGATGCGKSVVIRKGLKSFGLSDPTPYLVPSSVPGAPSSSYTHRIGRVSHNENSPDCPLHVIEIDVPASATDAAVEAITVWPSTLPRIDGVLICYDSSFHSSFQPVEDLLRGYHLMKLPIVVLACKSDLARQIEPERALEVLQQYDVGLVEVANAQELGKEKMRRSFDWLLRAVFRDRRTTRSDLDAIYRNPASPDVLTSSSPLWENSRTATPTATPSPNSLAQNQQLTSRLPSSPLPPTLPIFPTSPTRSRSTGDLLYENERSKNRSHSSNTVLVADSVMQRQDSNTESMYQPGDDVGDISNMGQDDQKDLKEKDSRPAQWATLEELLDKLLFLAVSGDDPAYISHFLLTYRRFASPRSVLLAMQKRMRQLDNPSGDPMFACFAQMRICHLLELWIKDYPYDFTVRGTTGALGALIKSIISKTYLLHYGSYLLNFIEQLPSLVDQDSAWALKVDSLAAESDDSDGMFDEDEYDDEGDMSEFESTAASSYPPDSPKGQSISASLPSRERKPSLPLSRSSMPSSGSTLNSSLSENAEPTPKQQIKDLVKLAQEVMTLDADEVAQEITRVEVKLFLQIKPRHWLHYTFVSGKKDTEPITAFNAVSNHLADWVVSLILCHDKPKARAKQMEKFVEIAQRLRHHNNYSALRAFVAGINNATFAGDETMEQFKLKSPEQAKNLQSWDVLLQHIRSHRAYRLALRNTKGACIPALEVHMSDLIRAHEGNEDVDPSDSNKIHWGKFNMMGRFIYHTIQCQAQCQLGLTTDYGFPDRDEIRELFVNRPIMSSEMQKSRIAPSDADLDDYRATVSHPPLNQHRDAILRKLLFW